MKDNVTTPSIPESPREAHEPSKALTVEVLARALFDVTVARAKISSACGEYIAQQWAVTHDRHEAHAAEILAALPRESAVSVPPSDEERERVLRLIQEYGTACDQRARNAHVMCASGVAKHDAHAAELLREITALLRAAR